MTRTTPIGRLAGRLGLRRCRSSPRTSTPTAGSRSTWPRRSTCSGGSTTAPPACGCRFDTGGEPGRGRRREPLPGHRRVPRLRAARHDRGGVEPTPAVEGSAYRMPYALPLSLAESLRALRECPPPHRRARRTLRPRLERGEGMRAAGVPPGHQLVGAGVPAAQRLIPRRSGPILIPARSLRRKVHGSKCPVFSRFPRAGVP